MSSNLRIGGLATGMDIDQIVSDMMKVQRMRREKLTQDKTLLEWKQADYRSLNAKLRELRDDTFKMKLQGTFLTKTVTSSDESAVSASAGTSATEGIYSIQVTSLATIGTKISSEQVSADSTNNPIDPTQSLWSQKDKFADSSAFGVMIEGDSFSLTVNGKEFTFANTESLNSIISKINSDSDAGVSLFYDTATDKVAVNTKETGSEAKINLGGDFWSLLRLDSTEVTGADAVVNINGLDTTRSSNTFTVNGVTINLKSETTDPVRLEIKRDTEGMFETIKGWVTKYNETLDAVNAELREQRYKDYLPLTDEQREELSDKQIEQWEERAKSGLLKNDSIIQGEISKMRTAIYSTVSGLNEESNHLSEIGISTGLAAFSDDGDLVITDDYLSGKLNINETKLREAIQNDPDGVMNLFTAHSDVAEEKGIGDRAYDALTSAMNRITDLAGDDASAVDWSFMGKRVRSLNEQIDREDDRLKMMEDRYWRQFTALEKAISQMNSQSAWLASQFGMGG